MAKFFGRYEHSLDPKGRVILPSKFRAAFEGGGYLSRFHERSLALWAQEDFDVQLAQMEEADAQGSEGRALARTFAEGTVEVEVDRQGRLAIPPYLRSFARLDGDVLVTGAITRVELWNPAVWAEKVAPREALWTDEGD